MDLTKLPDAILYNRDLIAHYRAVHNLPTQRDALDLISAEKRRRTERTVWDGTR